MIKDAIAKTIRREDLTQAEAEAAASLQHPHIVAIHETGQWEDQHYFSMDYVAGENLADAVRSQPLPPVRAYAPSAENFSLNASSTSRTLASTSGVNARFSSIVRSTSGYFASAKASRSFS